MWSVYMWTISLIMSWQHFNCQIILFELWKMWYLLLIELCVNITERYECHDVEYCLMYFGMTHVQCNSLIFKHCVCTPYPSPHATHTWSPHPLPPSAPLQCPPPVPWSQAQPIAPELVAKLLGNRVAVSPIVTVEPRRRRFHKPITLTIPVPRAAQKGMINQYQGERPTLRLLYSLAGRSRSLSVSMF